MNHLEIIAGLKDLAKDRESFFKHEPCEDDEIFRRDSEVLQAAAAAIEKADTRQAALDRILEERWANLEDVPFDEPPRGDLIMAEDWWLFPKGTEREDIWHFFDENYSKGVAFLLYGETAERSEKEAHK